MTLWVLEKCGHTGWYLMLQNAYLFKSQIFLVQESAYLSTSFSVATVASSYCFHAKSQSSSFPVAMALQ